jgi:hypothetical protein
MALEDEVLIARKSFNYFLVIIIGVAAMQKADANQEMQLYVRVLQSDTYQSVSDMDEVVIDNQPFEFRFLIREWVEGRRAAVRVAASLSRTLHQSLRPGVRHEQTTYYGMGTGMAAPKWEPYRTILLNDYGHHYIYFSQEYGSRINKATRLDQKNYEGSWIIKSIDDVPVEKFERRLFIAFMSDDNFNEIIDPGELIRFTMVIGRAGNTEETGKILFQCKSWGKEAEGSTRYMITIDWDAKTAIYELVSPNSQRKDIFHLDKVSGGVATFSIRNWPDQAQYLHVNLSTGGSESFVLLNSTSSTKALPAQYSCVEVTTLQ